MHELEIAFKCAYCGEEVDVELSDDGKVVKSDEYSSCLGEKHGVVATMYGGTLSASPGGDYEVVLRE